MFATTDISWLWSSPLWPSIIRIAFSFFMYIFYLCRTEIFPKREFDATISHFLYDLELSWRLSIIKFSRATSRVKWLNDEKTNVSRTISILVLRVLKWLESPSVLYIPARAPCSWLHASQWDWWVESSACPVSLSFLKFNLTPETSTEMVVSCWAGPDILWWTCYPIGKLGETGRALDSTHQSPLASALPWTWGSGRYIYIYMTQMGTPATSVPWGRG
jgi:hypothetical protein